jgi:anaerobic selenocysteine-containing dehydrogenase
MLNVIVKEKLYDKEFVEKWTTGFDELAARAADFTPERVAQITWIPAEKIVAAARLYATTRPACMQWGNGLDQHTNGFQTSRTIHCLSAITGNLDISGGDVAWVPPEGVKTFGGHGNFDLTLRDRITPEIKAKMLGVGKYKVMDGATMHPRALLDAIMTGQPYPVKALFVMGSNTLLNQTDSIRTAEAFKKVDFTVVTDMFMTPTAQLADIVLPASSWLENDEVADTHMGWCVLIRQKVAEIGECRDDKQILFDLAHRMGMNDDFPWKDVREFCNWTLEDTDIDFEEFKKIGILAGKMRYRKYEQDGFDTPSGKVELRCSTLEKMGYDPLISYVEPPESPVSTPELYREYPLIVTTGGRILGYFCSEGRQIPSLRKLNPDPLVDIHPETARSLGIKNGDWVWIESRRGRIRQRARVTDGIDPRVVHVQHGWWFPEKGPPDYGFTESNANILTGNMPCDPHTGSESMRAFLGKVYKV